MRCVPCRESNGRNGRRREPESASWANQYGAKMTRHARTVELPVELAPSDAPLRHRVADALIELLRTGHLRSGDTLPATRALAAELAIASHWRAPRRGAARPPR